MMNDGLRVSRRALVEIVLIFAVFCIQGHRPCGRERAALPGQGDPLREPDWLAAISSCSRRYAHPFLLRVRVVVAVVVAGCVGLDGRLLTWLLLAWAGGV